jgi:type II secretory ATPase GspE/PulE/Tfp pilus assembly ATPase PilB-like protein
MSDRYMRDYAGVLEASSMEPQVENVEITTYDSSQGQTPATVLPALIRKQPNVLVIFDLANAETVKILCQAASDDKLVLANIRAKEAVEALLRVLLLKVGAEEFAPAITAVVNQRLIRRLCESCKEAYSPPPELLKKLGIPKGWVQSFYRPPENPEEVCPDCEGIGYLGRTAIFELLNINDEIREVLTKQPKLDALRKAARTTNNRSLQEEGLVVVAQGVTSLAELKRVLEQ